MPMGYLQNKGLRLTVREWMPILMPKISLMLLPKTVKCFTLWPIKAGICLNELRKLPIGKALK